MGTLGAGNHYAEIQVVEEVFDKPAARKMGIDKVGQVCIMIHSGSRGLGHQVRLLDPPPLPACAPYSGVPNGCYHFSSPHTECMCSGTVPHTSTLTERTCTGGWWSLQLCRCFKVTGHTGQCTFPQYPSCTYLQR